MIFSILWARFRDFIQPLLCGLCFPPVFIGCRKLDRVERLTQNVERVVCPECGQHYVVHHGIRSVLKWDKEFEQLYADLERIKQKYGRNEKGTQ